MVLVKMNTNTQTYTVDEIAVILNIGRNSSYTLVNANQFRCLRVGSLIRIPCQSFNDWYYNFMDFEINKFDIEKKVYTVEEIAKVLNLKKTSAYALVKTEAFRSLRIGNSIRIPIDTFTTWLSGEE